MPVVDRGEFGGEDRSAVWAEDPVGVERGNRVEQLALADVDRLGVVGVVVGAAAVVVAWPAQVVGALTALAAEHPAPAGVEHHAAKHVRTGGLGVAVQLVAVARASLDLPPRVELVEHPLRNQRFMRRLGGPHPLHRIVDLAAPGAGGAAVEHLVVGVLGIAQDLVDAGLAPGPACPDLAGRHGWRVLGGVGIQTVGDRVVAETFVIAPRGHLRDSLAPQAVGLEPCLGLTLDGLGGVGVAVDLGLVAVRRFADVPAFAHMRAQSTPGLFEGVEDLVLGHRLVDPALQNSLRPTPGQCDRFVGGEQRDLDSFQLPFDREALEGAAGDSRDALADHDIESAAWMRGFVEQIGDAAVTSDRDVVALVVLTTTTLVEFHAA
ncbi:hypothetical protein SK803_37070 [Lentzea sp. BCCO 10_0856]|uniref:Uncharacterized protein n=1 Tax=Lentzea miocenica TaxID=3095431 RepID=A0ABU4TCD9_9PSEU|nr:hypothetical protein [Lentzea sp. BCCO 10_0856]MDX8035842.1 hypothetical protein [Lentzea sp. BCCO 10_0856]